MPKKMCLVCGAISGQTRCPIHRKTTNRGYGWRHQQTRNNAIKKTPFCWKCGCMNCSLQWHHVTELRGGRNPDTDERRQLLCKKCHDSVKEN